MLVLSRKKDGKIVINNGEIIITVVEIRDGKVRLGIEAPKEIPVHREEVFKAIKRSEEEEAEHCGRYPIEPDRFFTKEKL